MTALLHILTPPKQIMEIEGVEMKLKEGKLREGTMKLKDWTQKIKECTMKSQLPIEKDINHIILPP